MERRVLFQALVGSHNYNLNDETSDKDYKAFVIPTFDDLYAGEMFSKSSVGVDQDITVHDIRKLPHLWWKANVNFLEVLYSKDLKLVGATPEDWEDFKKIINLRSQIVNMNLKYLFDACVGMHVTKMKQVTKGTSGTKHLVEKFGYDTKQALHAYRIMDFLVRFANTGDFQKAMVYTNGAERDNMLAIKNGKYTLKEFEDLATNISNQAAYKYSYFSEVPDKNLKAELDNVIKNIVKREVVQ